MKRSLLVVLLSLIGCADQAPQGPNVVLISIDSVRADHLGAYGYRPAYAPEVLITPNIDSLAAEGVTFEQAWATSSWTLPSHMALMTGLADLSHAVIDDTFKLDPLRRTIAESFQAAGYTTAGYYSGPYLDPKYGFSRGFSEYKSAMMSPDELAKNMQRMKDDRVKRGQAPPTQTDMKAFRDRVSHWDITSPRVNAFALNFLKKQANSPFFLFVHYFDAHYDHIPDAAQKGLAQKFDPHYVGNFSGENWFFNPQVRSPQPPFSRRISDRDLGHVKAMYDAEIHWVDAHVGQIIQELKDQGQWENTVIALVSDHGDEFFEHGSIGHRSTLYTELLHAALIIRAPGTTLPGERKTESVALYDVAPTLLDLTECPPISESDGRSLKSTFLGKPASSPGSFGFIFTGTADGPQIQECWRDEQFTVIRPFQISRKGSSAQGIALTPSSVRALQIFDRKVDPREENPLPLDDPRRVSVLNRYKADFLQAQKKRQSRLQSPMSQRYSPAMTTEELATLAELGYVDGDLGKDGQVKTPPLLPLPVPGKL
ncbi:MAG: sulfatase [Planctomycetota bacterium]|nr:sulfatase [Planctomycetota bacterium]